MILKLRDNSNGRIDAKNGTKLSSKMVQYENQDCWLPSRCICDDPTDAGNVREYNPLHLFSSK